MGLREMKKERSRNAILDSARELFFQNGFDGTTIEAIAEKAEVAVGTVYNYFESKSAIILSITALDTSTLVEEPIEIPANGSGLEVLRNFVNTCLESLTAYPRGLLRELMGAAFSTQGEDLGEGLLRQDLTLINALGEYLAKLSAMGRLRSDINVEHASMVIYGMVMTSLMWYAADPQRTPKQMKDSMNGMLEIVFSGLEDRGDRS